MFKAEPHENKPLEWWHDQYLLDNIDMSPEYQRRSNIWSPWKKAHLIDSVINDFDIPKFYVGDFTALSSSPLNEKKKAYAVIDGKQRLQALFDFLDDKYPLNTTARFEDDPKAVVGGLHYSELRRKVPSAARKVSHFVPAVVHVITDEENKLEEMFVRLNSGEHTTGAERRNSMPGPIPAIIRELSMHPFFQRKIKFGTKRMQDMNLIAKLLLIESRGFVDTKKADLDEFVAVAHRSLKAAKTDDEREALDKKFLLAQTSVFDVLEHMAAVFKDADPLLANQGSIPVYYWLIRSTPPEKLDHVRHFLAHFTQAIVENRAKQRLDPDAADQTLSHYYTMSRTTNDEQSLAGRFSILETKFNEHLAQQQAAQASLL